MSYKQMFINLLIKDMVKSWVFFELLGYQFNLQFSNDQGVCFVLGENLFVMLFIEFFFVMFMKKIIVNVYESVEVLLCLSCDSCDEVDILVVKVVIVGGKLQEQLQDYGFMYVYGFEDFDGYKWEFVYMLGQFE